MGLEDLTGGAKFLDDLDEANPVGTTDTLSTVDDHIRGIKNVLKNTFPNVDGAVNLTPAEFNLLDGLTNLNFLRKDIADTLAEIVTFAKTYNEKAVTLGTGGSLAIDTSTGSLFYTGTLASIPTFTFTNPPTTGSVRSFTLELYNALNFAPVWPTEVEWAGNGTEPVWTAGKDLVSFYTRDAGATWVGTPGGLDFA
jgi:hypothetical protein